MTLTCENLGKSFGRKKVLDGLDATFGPGLNLLTGPSGAGKSTLLRILATADKPSRGTVMWKGEKLPGAKRKLRRVLGYSPQAIDWPEELTAREFGLHMAALKGLELKAADAQLAGILERLGLLPDIDNPIATFSGGMRRRLVVAQSLLGQPEMIALDEPTAELDAESIARVHDLLFERAGDTVIVMTTHLAMELEPRAAQNLRIDGAATPA
ncbi:ATP-binding cassette domain-containing protein [Paraurantiacibacter namhicola]|uniref:Putative ABC transporter ATP-binding protein YxlF n=1 Tax=Paraurantiacibacter namhicola TaxID=645517 RepID=A0A1C7D7E7_9SPHN|nr:ATP-binding cassette domain-containing protein [Paraurantiacibacter namhicola]ANU07251.1 putative ABC transporter ATP-binding protein YxlF [Paraurantiacibacter namhicola]